jgi:DNA-binding GntR family transcriptional regulator
MPRHNRGVHVDHDGPVPLYQQIADILRERIQAGRYPPGTPVPSIERIRQEIGVTIKTIRRGISVLTAEGYVVIVAGKGTFVTSQDRWPQGGAQSP